jgi:hypothetical protein
MPRRTEPYIIICRARVTPGCLDGEPTAKQFFGQDLPMSEDGTFSREPFMYDEFQRITTGSIVCDSCYLYLMPRTPSGKALNHELPAAIKAVQLRQQREREASSG